MVPTDQTDSARPLCSLGMRSTMVPDPIVMVATPANPERKRNTRNMASLLETAQSMVNPRNSTLVLL